MNNPSPAFCLPSLTDLEAWLSAPAPFFHLVPCCSCSGRHTRIVLVLRSEVRWSTPPISCLTPQILSHTTIITSTPLDTKSRTSLVGCIPSLHASTLPSVQASRIAPGRYQTTQRLVQRPFSAFGRASMHKVSLWPSCLSSASKPTHS